MSLQCHLIVPMFFHFMCKHSIWFFFYLPSSTFTLSNCDLHNINNPSHFHPHGSPQIFKPYSCMGSLRKIAIPTLICNTTFSLVMLCHSFKCLEQHVFRNFNYKRLIWFWHSYHLVATPNPFVPIHLNHCEHYHCWSHPCKFYGLASSTCSFIEVAQTT